MYVYLGNIIDNLCIFSCLILSWNPHPPTHSPKNLHKHHEVDYLDNLRFSVGRIQKWALFLRERLRHIAWQWSPCLIYKNHRILFLIGERLFSYHGLKNKLLVWDYGFPAALCPLDRKMSPTLIERLTDASWLYVKGNAEHLHCSPMLCGHAGSEVSY